MVKQLFRLFVMGVAVLALTDHAASAQPAPPSNPSGLCKAGIAAFGVGQAGIYVNYAVPWPAGAKYVVAVQPTNTAGYSPTSVCTYFNVLKKTNLKFEVQHKRCDNGTPLALDVAVSLDWIACPIQQ